MRSLVVAALALFVVICLVLGGCSDPYRDWPVRPAGYAGNIQIWEERATGCLYTAPVKGEAKLSPLNRPDGSQMGCEAKK